MNGDLITVEILINGVLFKPALIDTGCECYSIVDKNLVTELRLPRVKIPPKPIINFIKENIKDVTRGVSPCRKLGLAKCNATKASQGDDFDG